MKNYFEGQIINISNKRRKAIVLEISNIICAKRDRLPAASFDEVIRNGKRGKYVIRVFNSNGRVIDLITGFYDFFTSDSQVLEHVNDNLPRILKDKTFSVIAGRDGNWFNANKLTTIKV